MNNVICILLQNPKVSTAAERYLLVYMIAVLMIVTTLVILFFIVFQKRKNQLLKDKIKQQQAFEEEISRTQIEIQEQTLKNIGQELHDNIGQLLSVANMQMSVMSMQVSEAIKEPFTETKDIVKQGLSELRLLSKSLNSDVIVNRGFEESVSSEINRLNKLKLLTANLILKGESSYFSNNKDSIILFRILQEFISNTVKYAKANTLQIELEYQKNKLIIIAKDDGLGFDITKAEKGAGLLNMQNRAELIHSEFNLSSEPNKGTTLKLEYPYRVIDTLKL
ncbi:sensor histidine kinase [Lacinutrix salivirga]